MKDFLVGRPILKTNPEETGTETNPYLIPDLETLEAFRDDINSGNTYEGKFIKLTADIDMSDKYSSATGTSWTPRGSSSNIFNGSFDGNGELVINEEEAKTVRYIFNRYLEGVGYKTIARELEAKGCLTGAGNTKWHDSTIRGILENEKYYGDLLQQKTVTVDYLSHKRVDNKGQKEQFLIKENHQPIISKELWLAVQKKREDKFSKTSGNDTNRERFASKYAFSGKLICANCGNTLKRRTWNAKTDAERIVWQCNDYINKGKRSCDSKAVGDLTIKRAFVEVYNSILNDKSEFFDTFIKTIERIIKKGHD